MGVECVGREGSLSVFAHGVVGVGINVLRACYTTDLDLDRDGLAEAQAREVHVDTVGVRKDGACRPLLRAGDACADDRRDALWQRHLDGRIVDIRGALGKGDPHLDDGKLARRPGARLGDDRRAGLCLDGVGPKEQADERHHQAVPQRTHPGRCKARTVCHGAMFALGPVPIRCGKWGGERFVYGAKDR